MAHLIEEYAKNLGVRTAKPIIQPHFFPIKCKKFILLDLSVDTPSKKYAHYQMMISLIMPELKNCGISIIQIGGEKALAGVSRHINCGFKNLAYILSKSMLYIGPDNYLSQYASSINIKTLILFGNTYANTTKPYWGGSVCLEPEWKEKPSYSDQDPFHSISSIKPERVTQEIIQILQLKCGLNFKTKNIGSGFYKSIHEIVPTQIVEGLPKEIYLRADYGIEKGAFLYLCAHHKVSIVTDSLFQISVIKDFKDNINKIMFIVDKDTEEIPEKYFEILKSWSIEISILVKNEEELPFIRNKYFDIPVNLLGIRKEKIECSQNAKFLTNKKIIEGDKTYYSYAHYKKGLDSDKNVLDTPEYWEELEHFYIYEQH